MQIWVLGIPRKATITEHSSPKAQLSYGADLKKKIVGLLCSYLPIKIGPTQHLFWPFWRFFLFLKTLEPTTDRFTFTMFTAIFL